MNKRTVLASLNKIANELDNNGLHNEADTVTKVMSRLAMDGNDEYNMDDYGICPDCGEYIGDGENCARWEQCHHLWAL
jgi:RNA polymerase-binding transcription factor DksA